MVKPSAEERQRFERMLIAVQPLIDEACGEAANGHAYLPGVTTLEMHEEGIPEGSGLTFERALCMREEAENPFEDALVSRLSAPGSHWPLILAGGLGSGKSTTARFILEQLMGHAAELRAEYPCAHKPCYRSPVYVDCRSQVHEGPLPTMTADILRHLRQALYMQLISEWLQANEVDAQAVWKIDPHYRTLRRLLVVNDLAAWAEGEKEGAFPLELGDARLTLVEPLLSQKASLELITGWRQAYGPATEQAQSAVRAAARNPEAAIPLTSCAVGLYLGTCQADSPLNLIVVDNLDQLPTDYIQALINVCHTLTMENPSLRVLLPLRPSSFGIRGFIRDTHVYPHHGPDCFRLALSRLACTLFSRSEVSLRERMSLGPKGDALPKQDTRDAIRYLMLAGYVYEAIAQSRSPQARAAGLRHADHLHLKHVTLDEVALAYAGTTLDALVGTSARYAMVQLRRFLTSAFREPRMLLRAASKGYPFVAPTRAPIYYKQVIGAILGIGVNETDIRLANVFAPTESSANPSLPSVVKLRTLSELARENRLSLRQLLARLAAYGVPKELGIASLNYLHEKERLLVFFSKNRDLRSTAEDLEEQVTISEHGRLYFEQIVGDFEYIWYCATHVPQDPNAETSFKHRLSEYRRLTSSFGQTEWKQVGLHRYNGAHAGLVGSELTTGEFLILRVLYGSLVRAIRSGEVALGVVHAEGEYAAALNELFIAVLGTISEWQRRYQKVFGGASYLWRKEFRDADLVPAVTRFVGKPEIAEEARAAARGLLEDWQKTPECLWTWSSNGHAEAIPREDLVTRLSKVVRGSVGWLSDWVSSLDKVEAANATVAQFLSKRECVRRLLEQTLPAYSTVESRLGDLVASAREVAELTAELAATGTGRVVWFVSEEEKLRSILEELRGNAYRIEGLVDAESMSEYKSRARAIGAVLHNLGQHLGAQDIEHLKCEWSL